MDTPKDMRGIPFAVGQSVVKAQSRSNVATLDIRTVAKIEAGKVYLNGSKLVCLNYPERVLILMEAQS